MTPCTPQPAAIARAARPEDASQTSPEASCGAKGANGAQRLIVSLPLPPVELQPNRKAHYAAKSQRAREARFWAALTAAEAMRVQMTGLTEDAPAFGACRATVQVTWPDRIRRDLDNLLASTKAYWDGFTDAGVWEDDSAVTWVLPPARVDKQTAGVVVTVEPMEGD